MDTKSKSVLLDIEDLEKIKILSKQKGCSQNAVIRMLIREVDLK